MQMTQVLFVVLALSMFISCTLARYVQDYDRLKRTGSDQRIAELQALLALSNAGGRIGHGQVDPFAIGKRKRSDDFVDAATYDDMRRLRLLQRVIEALNDDSS